MQRFVRSLPVAVLLFLINAAPHAQVDLTGLWRPLARNEDGSGMDGDYAGLPLNAAGRWRAQSWSPENFERQRNFLVEAIERAALGSMHARALSVWAQQVLGHPRESIVVGRRWQWTSSTASAS